MFPRVKIHQIEAIALALTVSCLTVPIMYIFSQDIMMLCVFGHMFAPFVGVQIYIEELIFGDIIFFDGLIQHLLVPFIVSVIFHSYLINNFFCTKKEKGLGAALTTLIGLNIVAIFVDLVIIVNYMPSW